MGYPTFYLYPERGGALRVASFDRVISDVYPTPTRIAVDAVGGDGGVTSMLGPGALSVTIRRERTSDAALVRMWRNVEDHLLRRGRVGFSWDHAKTWAGYSAGVITQGDTLVYTHGNSFSTWSASAALTGGDEVVIESPNPEMKRTYATISSITSGAITLSAGAWINFENTYMVRYSKFWPALFLPEALISRARITGDRGLTHNLDLTLAVDPRILVRSTALSGRDLGLRPEGVKTGAGGFSLEDYIHGTTRYIGSDPLTKKLFG